MHIVFVDTVDWHYDIDAPLTRPVGGTQSAVCYVMKALAARGVRVSFINNTVPYEKHGIRALGQQLSGDVIRDADAVVFVSDPRLPAAQTVKKYVNNNTKFVLWLHHAPDQPVVQPLAEPAVAALWDAVVYLSQWQQQTYQQQFPALVDTPSIVLRNAIAPAFENLFDDLPVLAFKRWPPVLAYTSTPFRGLDRLLASFDILRNTIPESQLNIYSSMQVYNVAAVDDGYQNLYEAARQAPNVDYIGPLPQTALALQLREVFCLTYPNSFPETSCIAVMEAMAAGCLVVTSDLGALPETLHGFGVLKAFVPNAVAHANDFAAACAAAINTARIEWQAGELEQKLAAQVAWVNDNYTWSKRAAEWEDFLSL